MRKLSTFLTVIAVALIVAAPCKVHATTFTPPTDSVTVKAFPNPTADYVKFESTNGSNLWNAEIVIYSLNGEQIFKRQFADGIVSLNKISKYPVQSSTYIINILDERGAKIQSISIAKFRN